MGNPKLLLEVDRLRKENALLSAELEFLRANPAIAKGLKGETLVAQILSAQLAHKGSGHDIVASNGAQRIEVKYSSLLNAIGGRPIKRWVWTKLFGELGKKYYDRLFLIGDTDPRFAEQYSDPSSPYVIFDIPYPDVVAMTDGIHSGRMGQIHLTTNPESVKSTRSKALFRHYQVTITELQYRYPTLESAIR